MNTENSDTIEITNPAVCLSEFSQFIETTLNPDEIRGSSFTGYINVLNGCFVVAETEDVSLGLLKRNKKVFTGELTLYWLTGSYDNNAHAVKIKGHDVTKFISAMRCQSESLREREIFRTT